MRSCERRITISISISLIKQYLFRDFTHFNDKVSFLPNNAINDSAIYIKTRVNNNTIQYCKNNNLLLPAYSTLNCHDAARTRHVYEQLSQSGRK